MDTHNNQNTSYAIHVILAYAKYVITDIIE